MYMNRDIPKENFPNKQPAKRGGKPINIAAGIVILVSLWILSGVFSDDSSDKKGIKSDYGLPKVKVEVMAATVRNQSIMLYGVTEPSMSASLFAEVEGMVTEIIAKEGTELKRGEPILRIQNRDRLARVEEAKARLAQREIEHKAAKGLSAKGFQSQAKAAEAKADLEMAKADLKRAEVDLAKTVIRAPFDGVLDRLDVDVGDLVGRQNGGEVGFYVANDPIVAVANVSERDIGDVEEGMETVVRMVTGDELMGKISYVGKVSDPATRTFRVEVEIENEFGDLPAGTTTEMKIITGQEDAHLIPNSALSLNDEGKIGVKIFKNKGEKLKTVEKVPGVGLVEFFPVTTREDTGNGIWVYGLPDTVFLITMGHAFVDNGDVVIGKDEQGRPAGASRELDN